MREALTLGHNWIGTEHILLGLARETEGVAARILLDFDTSLRDVADDVLAMLGGTYAQSLAVESPVVRRGGRMPRRVYTYGESGRRHPQIVVGSVVSAVGFPVGLLAGWLIWG